MKNTITIKKNYTDKDFPYPFPFSYIFLNYTVCPFATVLYIYVISECIQINERKAVRKTWGKNLNKNITLRFIIGIGKKYCDINYYYEHKKYEDILQINIYESFSNETLFSLYTMKYLNLLCPYAYYYAKFDVDTYVNIIKLYEMLKNQNRNKLHFWGAELNKWKRVNYDKNYKYSSPLNISKYYNSLFPKGGIPVYSGFCTVFSYDIPSLIYNASLKYRKLLRIDDQYISWLLYKLNIKIKSISSYAILPNKCWIDKNVLVIHRIRSYDLIAYSHFLNET